MINGTSRRRANRHSQKPWLDGKGSMIRSIVARGVRIGLSAASIAVTAAPGHASDCTLNMLAKLPVTMHEMRPTLPIKINGQDTTIWLDGGAFFNTMPAAKAAELGLSLQDAPEGLLIIGIGGLASVRVTTVKSFGIVVRNSEIFSSSSAAAMPATD